jgi:hypothetical protein
MVRDVIFVESYEIAVQAVMQISVVHQHYYTFVSRQKGLHTYVYVLHDFEHHYFNKKLFVFNFTVWFS